MGTGLNGDGWGRILILQGQMGTGINVRPRAGLYKRHWREARLSCVCVCVCVCTAPVYDGSVHVFYGYRLWRLADYGLDADAYPVHIRSVYNYAPNVVDAAVYSTRTYLTYLFSGTRPCIFTRATLC